MFLHKRVKPNLYSPPKYPTLTLPRHTPAGDLTREHVRYAIKAYLSENSQEVWDQLGMIEAGHRKGNLTATLATYIGAFQNPNFSETDLTETLYLSWDLKTFTGLFKTQILWNIKALEALVGDLPRVTAEAERLRDNAVKVIPAKDSSAYAKYDENVWTAYITAGSWVGWTAENCHIAAALTSNREFAYAFGSNTSISEDVKIMAGLLSV